MKIYGFTKRIIILILVALFCFGGRAQNTAVMVDDPLCRAMQATGAELCRAYITGRVSLSESMMEEADARLVLEETARVFGIVSADIEVQESVAQKCFKLSYSDPMRQIVIAVSQLDHGQAGSKSPELLIHIIQQNPLHTDIAEIKQLMTNFLQKFNKMQHINTCLEGYLDGKLRKDEKVFCLQDAVDVIGVKVVDRISSSNYMGCTGYTPMLSQQVMAAGKAVNFHIALRYHSFDNRTYVFIGSPLITVDY